MNVAPTEIHAADPEFVAQLMDSLTASQSVFQSNNDVVILHPKSKVLMAYSRDGALGHALHGLGLAVFVDRHGNRARNPVENTYVSLGRLVRLFSCDLPTIRQLFTSCALTNRNRRLISPEAGYDAATQSLVTGHPPPPWDGERRLCRLFEGVPFRSDHDRANLITFAVAGLARPALDSFPHCLITADRKNVGKTRLATALSYLYDSRGYISWSNDENRTEFSLAAHCDRPGPNFLVIDNVRAKQGQNSLIRSQALSAMTSFHDFGLAPKMKSVRPLFDPVIIATMNDGRLEYDLADKAIVVALEGGTKRNHYTKTDWVAYCADNSSQLLAEAHSILIDHELRNLRDKAHTRFGDFEELFYHIGYMAGLPVCLKEEVSSSANTILFEINSVLEEIGEAVPVPEFLRIANTNRTELVELPATIKNLGVLAKQRPAAFARWFELNAANRPFFSDGKRVKLTITGEEIRKESV